jgi:hypothetical protein
MWMCSKCATYFKREPYVCPHCGEDAPAPAPVYGSKQLLPSVQKFVEANEPVLETRRKRRLLWFVLSEYLPSPVPLLFLLGGLAFGMWVFWGWFQREPDPCVAVWTLFVGSSVFAFMFGLIGVVAKGLIGGSVARDDLAQAPLLPPPPSTTDRNEPADPNTSITSNPPAPRTTSDDSLTTKPSSEGKYQ